MQNDVPSNRPGENSDDSSVVRCGSGSNLRAQQGASLVSLNLNRLWERCLQKVRPQVEVHIFNAYVSSLRFISFDAHSRRCVVCAPSRFISNYVDQHLRRILEAMIGAVFCPALNCSPIGNFSLTVGAGSTVGEVLLGRAGPEGLNRSYGATLEIEIDTLRTERSDPVWVMRGVPPVTGPKAASQNFGAQNSGSQNSAAFKGVSGAGNDAHGAFGGSGVAGSGVASVGAGAHKSFLSSRYNFDNFVVGNNSQFVHAAALQVSEQPGQRYNPLFIYGGVGLGKTHLLHAIGNALLASNPSARVLYLSSETFTNELIQSLRIGKMDEFKTRLRTIDLLLIDDIQFISGKERTQEEFFHTFNALYSARKQIVLTADKMPQDMPGIEERLQTRFTWGLAADLQAPDFETRVAIVNKKCAAEGIELSSEVSHFIAERVSSNVRELEGALTRLHAYASLQKRCVDLNMAELALKPFTQKRAVTLSSEDIKRAVATHFGVRPSEMVSKTRTKSVSFPRHVAMFLCRKHTTLSYPEIGGQFGGRDHSSVIHAANVVAGKIQSDQEIRKVVQEIENRLLGG